MIRRSAILLAIPLALSACGGRQALQRTEGMEPPATPRGATKIPSAAELMEPSTQARPERSAELLRESKERQDDPFDLPPE